MNLLFLKCSQVKSKWYTPMKYYCHDNFYIKRWPCFWSDEWALLDKSEKNVTDCLNFFHKLYFLIPRHSFHSVKLCPQRNFKSVLCLFGLTVLLLHHFSKDPRSSRRTWSPLTWFEVQGRQRLRMQEVQGGAHGKEHVVVVALVQDDKDQVAHLKISDGDLLRVPRGDGGQALGHQSLIQPLVFFFFQL